MSLKTIYIETTVPELGECAVSINTVVQTHADPAKQIAYLNRLAKARGLKATYRLATADEYAANRQHIRDQIAAAKVTA